MEIIFKRSQCNYRLSFKIKEFKGRGTICCGLNQDF